MTAKAELNVVLVQPAVMIEGKVGSTTINGLYLSLEDAKQLRDRLDAALENAA